MFHSNAYQGIGHQENKLLSDTRTAILTKRDQVFPECAECLDLDIVVEFHAIFHHVITSTMIVVARLLENL